MQQVEMVMCRSQRFGGSGCDMSDAEETMKRNQPIGQGPAPPLLPSLLPSIVRWYEQSSMCSDLKGSVEASERTSVPMVSLSPRGAVEQSSSNKINSPNLAKRVPFASHRLKPFIPRTFVTMSLTAYSKAASYAHWIVAVPLIGCVGTGV